MQTMDFPFFTTNIFGYWRKPIDYWRWIQSIGISKFIPTVIEQIPGGFQKAFFFYFNSCNYVCTIK